MVQNNTIKQEDSEALIKQILPLPSNQTMTNRFATASDAASCDQGGCSGACHGFR